MAAAPKITVGLPVYNAEPWLRQTLTALLAQSYDNFILDISDNASTDGTGNICLTFAQQDKRIRYSRNSRNIGVFRNYNKVFLQAETPYFKWASANDLCARTFLEDCLAALESNPAAVLAYPRTIVFVEDINVGENWPYDPDIRDRSPATRFMRVLREIRLNNAFNGLIRTDALRHTSLNKIYRGSDIGLLAELALQGEIMRLPSYLFCRRLNPAAASSLRDAAGLREFFAAESRDVMGTPTWDFHWHCFGAALKSPPALRYRIQCAAHVARALWWKRRELWNELRMKTGEPYRPSNT